MEISKGMYIRFNGFISKIGHINISKKGNTYVQFKQPNGLLAHTRIENIDKASFNIIDLIEVGDYVNGERVYYAYCSSEGSTGLFIEEAGIRVWLEKDSQIKDIVTNEQFNSMKYVVERDKQMNEYSFIVEFDEMGENQINKLWEYLSEKNIKFHVLEEDLKNENQKLKKQLEGQDYTVIPNSEIKPILDKYKNQQKEFIEWLEEMIKSLFKEEKYEIGATYGYILSKYKEIIGGDNNE